MPDRFQGSDGLTTAHLASFAGLLPATFCLPQMPIGIGDEGAIDAAAINTFQLSQVLPLTVAIALPASVGGVAVKGVTVEVKATARHSGDYPVTAMRRAAKAGGCQYTTMRVCKQFRRLVEDSDRKRRRNLRTMTMGL